MAETFGAQSTDDEVLSSIDLKREQFLITGVSSRHPERISAIVSQNGNAYPEGFSTEWGPWKTYWHEPSAANREACRPSLAPDTIRNWQYGTGADPTLLSPAGYELDIAYMGRPDAEEIQLDLNPRLPQ